MGGPVKKRRPKEKGFQKQKVVLESKGLGKKVVSILTWGRVLVGDQRDAQRQAPGDAQGPSPVMVQKGNWEQQCSRNQQDFLSNFPRPAATSLPGWKARAREHSTGVGE